METINPWHFVWIGVIISELFTLILSLILSYFWWGHFNKEVIVIGAIDAFIVAFLVTWVVIYFASRVRDELERQVEERTRVLELTHQQLLHVAKLGAIGKLSASIAHEFNNPLQGVMNILQGVMKRADLDEDDKELMTIAVKENERMRDLINSLQDFNRPTTGKASLVNINEILDNLLLLGKKGFKSKGINIETHFDENIPPIMAVSDQIQQVLLNLLHNATDACSMNDSITIVTKKSDGKAIVEVHDTGNGIAHEIKDQIFDPFFTTKPEVKGTGLGLSVSYGIINKHYGNIEVDSEPGKGSIFTVTLPIDGEISNA